MNKLEEAVRSWSSCPLAPLSSTDSYVAFTANAKDAMRSWAASYAPHSSCNCLTGVTYGPVTGGDESPDLEISEDFAWWRVRTPGGS